MNYFEVWKLRFYKKIEENLIDQNGGQLLLNDESMSSITDIFNEGLKMQRQSIAKLVSGNLKLAMEENKFWKRIRRSGKAQNSKKKYLKRSLKMLKKVSKTYTSN